MRLPFYGLRAGILTQLLFLIIAAMLLVNIVMLNLQVRDLIQAKIDMGKLVIRALERIIYQERLVAKKRLKDIGLNNELKENITSLFLESGYREFVIVDQGGLLSLNITSSDEIRRSYLTDARAALGEGTCSVNYLGSSWGVLWPSKEYVTISAPLVIKGMTLGGITVGASLTPIYQQLRKSEKVVIFYIIMDTLILAIVGIYLLSRIVVKPIHKLLKMTEGYKDGDILPSVEENSRNEIGALSRSFAGMLERLDENKKELKAHIHSLEKANQELRKAQDEIIRSEKLASVGRLAAGIAHEIGNPIGIVLGYLDLLKKGNITESTKKDFLDRAESEVARISLIIRQLLDFSRTSNGKNEECNIHDLIMDTVDMVKPQPIMEKVTVSFDLKAPNNRIIGDPNQIKQVFLNIIMNALDVFADDESYEDKKDCELHIMTKEMEGSIEISFTDNGPGIHPKEIIHVFDPFYTTKEPGRGTGLGLSVSYRIIEAYRGTIVVESDPGEGTTVFIRLPLCLEGRGGDSRNHKEG